MKHVDLCGLVDSYPTTAQTRQLLLNKQVLMGFVHVTSIVLYKRKTMGMIIVGIL